MDHRRAYVLMPQKLLHRAEIISSKLQFNSKGMTQCVGSRRLGEARSQDGGDHGLLDDAFVQVISMLETGLAMGIENGTGTDRPDRSQRWYHPHRDDQSETAKPLRAGFRLHTLQHANDFVDGIHIGGGFSFFQATERFGPDPRAAGQISLRQTGRLPPADNLAARQSAKAGIAFSEPRCPRTSPRRGKPDSAEIQVPRRRSSNSRSRAACSSLRPPSSSSGDNPRTRASGGNPRTRSSGSNPRRRSSGGNPRRRFSAGIASSTAVCSSSSTSPRYSVPVAIREVHALQASILRSASRLGIASSTRRLQLLLHLAQVF